MDGARPSRSVAEGPRRHLVSLPLQHRHRFILPDGTVAEVELIVAPARAWDDLAASRLPDWSIVIDGPIVTATRIVI